MRQTLKVLITILAMVYALDAQAFDTFTWMNTNDNSQTLSEIKLAFADELQPDNLKKVKPAFPYAHKYLLKIGAFRTTRIVVIGYREKKDDPKEYDQFRSFCYDVSTGVKQEIEPKDRYYHWSFVTQAAFEPSATPDIVFKYFKCVECEQVELLASFRFDEKDSLWKRRIWPDNDADLMINSDRQYGREDDWLYDCLFKVADFNSDHFADIAIRCRETGEATRSRRDNLLLYTIQKGAAKRLQIRDARAFDKISQVLCAGQDSPLCNKAE